MGDFFAQARLERDTQRGREKEELKNITIDKSAPKDSVSKAYDQMMDIIKLSEKEANIESLIKQKGFKDAIIYFSQDGSIDLVVKASSLSAAETAQLVDIVSRHTSTDIENIHIKNEL